MKQTVKDVLKFSLFSLITLFVSRSKNIEKNSLLLIRLDAIGDYVLFRNFIEVLAKSEKYKDHTVTFLGNAAYKGLALELDSSFVDRFLWIDEKRFRREAGYRFKMLKAICAKGYETVVNTAFSRKFFSDDAIVRCVHAQKKIGSECDLINIKPWQKSLSDRYYTKLLPVKSGVLFEFFRNRDFFEALLGQAIDLQKPFMDVAESELPFPLPDRYAVLFIGAGGEQKKWRAENFAKAARHLKEAYGRSIVICGSKGEKKEAEVFKNAFQGDCIDLVGQTDMMQLLQVIKKASFMLTNDTSAPHIAVAMQVAYAIVVIYNFYHLGRFLPYPESVMTNLHIVNDSVQAYLDDINHVSVERVMVTIDNVLKQNRGSLE